MEFPLEIATVIVNGAPRLRGALVPISSLSDDALAAFLDQVYTETATLPFWDNPESQLEFTHFLNAYDDILAFCRWHACNREAT